MEPLKVDCQTHTLVMSKVRSEPCCVLVKTRPHLHDVCCYERQQMLKTTGIVPSFEAPISKHVHHSFHPVIPNGTSTYYSFQSGMFQIQMHCNHFNVQLYHPVKSSQLQSSPSKSHAGIVRNFVNIAVIVHKA